MTEDPEVTNNNKNKNNVGNNAGSKLTWVNKDSLLLIKEHFQIASEMHNNN